MLCTTVKPGRVIRINNSEKALRVEAKFYLDVGHRATVEGSVR